jgi:hypothetical protein
MTIEAPISFAPRDAQRPIGPCAKTATASHAAGLRAADAGRSDVSEQDHLLVGDAVRNLRQIRLRARHEQVLRLRAVDGVAEAPAADGLVAAAVAALREFAGEAGVALTARGDGADDDAIADRVAGHADSQLFDDADWLVADDQARLDRILAAGDVQVGAADRGHRHTDDGLARSGVRPRHFLDADVVDAMKNGGAHRSGCVSVGNQHLFDFECGGHGCSLWPVSTLLANGSVMDAW